LIRANTLSSSRTCWAMGCRPRPAIRRSLINGPRFPLVTACDKCAARSIACDREVRHLAYSPRNGLVDGARYRPFNWGALYPDMMDLIAPFCGSAKCSRHNFVFLEGVKAALTADAAWKEGWYHREAGPRLRGPRRACLAGWDFAGLLSRQRRPSAPPSTPSRNTKLWREAFRRSTKWRDQVHHVRIERAPVKGL